MFKVLLIGLMLVSSLFAQREARPDPVRPPQMHQPTPMPTPMPPPMMNQRQVIVPPPSHSLPGNPGSMPMSYRTSPNFAPRMQPPIMPGQVRDIRPMRQPIDKKFDFDQYRHRPQYHPEVRRVFRPIIMGTYYPNVYWWPIWSSQYHWSYDDYFLSVYLRGYHDGQWDLKHPNKKNCKKITIAGEKKQVCRDEAGVWKISN